MTQAKLTAISPTRKENYAQWYQEVIKAADLAEHSPVRGCMTIKPWGYGIWEKIQNVLNKKIKDTGHENYYFPMFVPLSFINKEAKHVDGFATECAVVTHHRLRRDQSGTLVPDGQLEEPLIVRPTSETIIGEAFSRWINSYRDLPLMCNQWANVVRWEMRPRLFLRTTEFLWQEGHTAHATQEEALDETLKMLYLYNDFLRNYLAIPSVVGRKTENEKFPGAEHTYCLEAMMQDGKALQAGTSHMLGQNFSKTFNIRFLSQNGSHQHVWTTSWGVTTRLIGALIMTHSDDNGLVLPPNIAPLHVVIIPIVHDEANQGPVIEYCNRVKALIGDKYNVTIDLSHKRAGEKCWHHVKKGVPIRLELGMKEIETNYVCATRRDQLKKEVIALDDFINRLGDMLQEMQDNLLNSAIRRMSDNTFIANSQDDFLAFFNQNQYASPFVMAHWCGDSTTEEMLKSLQITARCIPIEQQPGRCIFTGAESAPVTLFAKAY